FVSMREAAEGIAAALYSGIPDRPVVGKLRQSGLDVTDGAATEEAISKIWAAVDNGKIQPFVIGAKRREPLRFSAEMSKEVPGLRSPRGGDLHLLRSSEKIFQSGASIFPRDIRTRAVAGQD